MGDGSETGEAVGSDDAVGDQEEDQPVGNDLDDAANDVEDEVPLQQREWTSEDDPRFVRERASSPQPQH
jgi:hypothetical protein